MAIIEIQILGRKIPISCLDGEEQKVQALAKSLNDNLADAKIKMPNTHDINILVINNLIQMDAIETLQKAQDSAESAQGVLSQVEPSVSNSADNSNCETLKALQNATEYLEQLASKLEKL